MLQHAATRCHTLQHAATRWAALDILPLRTNVLNTLQHNTRQQTATHCNTLQYTAPRRAALVISPQRRCTLQQDAAIDMTSPQHCYRYDFAATLHCYAATPRRSNLLHRNTATYYLLRRDTAKEHSIYIMLPQHRDIAAATPRHSNKKPLQI